MSTQPANQSRSEWTTYAVVMLLILFIGAMSQALLVPPAWRGPKDAQPQQQKHNPSQGQPPADQNQTQTAASVPPTGATAPTRSRQDEVCGVWVSATSEKRYDFVCGEKGAVKVRQINAEGPKNTGSGKVSDDGKIDIDLLVLPNNRTAHLTLRLSDDGQKLDGSWRGEAPTESGKLAFRKVESN